MSDPNIDPFLKSCIVSKELLFVDHIPIALVKPAEELAAVVLFNLSCAVSPETLVLPSQVEFEVPQSTLVVGPVSVLR